MTTGIERARGLLGHLVSKEDATMDDFRRLYDEVLAEFVLPDDAESEQVDADGVAAFWVSAPGADASRVSLLVHGGGWTMGTASGYRELAYRLSKASGQRILVVDYRLAPEHPYPAPHDDVVTAYRWARSQEGVQSVAITGDSAGGGLATGAALALRSQDVAQPTALVLMSPLLDLAGESPSLDDRAHLDPLPAKVLVVNMGGAFLGGRSIADAEFASPMHVDPTGLPPTLIFVGTDEGLHDDGVRFAEKITESGGDATVVEGEGMIHIWPLFNFLPEAATAVDQAGSFLSKHAE